MNSQATYDIPVRIGTAEEFADIVRVLTEASFNEQTIVEAFQLTDMSEIGSITTDAVARAEISPQLRLLVRLFFLIQLIERTEVEELIGRSLESFLSVGLLGSNDDGQTKIYARALIYPVSGFWIASDRHSAPGDGAFEPPPDIVFPAVFRGTLDFLRVLPRTWNGAALDLCSGSGIGALALAQFGGPTVSSDITERAAAFARFNCALNQIANVEVVCGDLYEAVAGRSFGCIVAHPPYVPSFEKKVIWRDGGTTGDSLVRRIVTDLPQFLERGGSFICISLGVDTKTESFENRVRGWLGAAADQFDLIFACEEQRDPKEVLKTLGKQYGENGEEIVQKFEREFLQEGVVKMTLGALFIKRHLTTDLHSPITLRTNLSKESDGSDFEKVLKVCRKLSKPNFLSTLEQSILRLAPNLEVTVTHVVSGNTLVPADILFAVDKPFAKRARFEPWMVTLLTGIDGQATLSQIYDKAREDNVIPEDFKLINFAILVARTLEMGFTLLE